MLLEENFDADAILREPGDNMLSDESENEEGEETVSELNFGGNQSMDSLDIPPEEEEDLW